MAASTEIPNRPSLFRSYADHDIAIHPSTLLPKVTQLARGGLRDDLEKSRGLFELERHSYRCPYRDMYEMDGNLGGHNSPSHQGPSLTDGKVRVCRVHRAYGRPVMYTGEIRGVVTRSKYLMSVAKAALSPKLVEESETVPKQIHRRPVGVVVLVTPPGKTDELG